MALKYKYHPITVVKTELQTLIDDVRAIIISAKGGVSIHQVPDDYRVLVGSAPPFEKFGFCSTREFLASQPKEFLIRGDTVQAVEKRSSAHVAKLVRQQKQCTTARSNRVSSHFRKRLVSPPPDFNLSARPKIRSDAERFFPKANRPKRKVEPDEEELEIIDLTGDTDSETETNHTGAARGFNKNKLPDVETAKIVALIKSHLNIVCKGSTDDFISRVHASPTVAEEYSVADLLLTF